MVDIDMTPSGGGRNSLSWSRIMMQQEKTMTSLAYPEKQILHCLEKGIDLRSKPKQDRKIKVKILVNNMFLEETQDVLET